MKDQGKKILIQVLVIVFFAVLSYAYFYPTLEGKVMPQMDFEHSKAIAHEADTYQEQLDRDITWTNSLFGGMPTYQVGGFSKKNVFAPILRAINHTILPYATVSTFFIYLLGFYILLLVFKVDKWLSVVGAIAFALSSYNIIIIAAGHVTKTYAIGFMPIIFAGFILLYDKKYWLGILTALLGLGQQIATSHIQIVYYTGLAIGLFIVFKFFWLLKEKKLKQFYVASAISVAILGLVLLPNLPTMWQAYEISKYSIRGQSELNSSKEQGKGLDKDYALAWSYGIDESFTFLIPNAKGGGTGYISENKKALENVDPQYKDAIAQQNHYWGDQPFTSGPVYLGAIVFFLFILGMFIVKNKIKWWIFAATILALMLSWGKNFGLLTNPFFDLFPFYNKFRTVSMILVIPSVTVPLLSFLAVKEILEDRDFLKKNIKKLWYSLGIIALLLIIPFTFSFVSANEVAQFDEYIKQAPQQTAQINAFIEELESARRAIFRADAFRSLLFVILGAGLLLAFTNIKGLKKYTFVGILGFLVLVDMWSVDRRYLSADDFVSKSKSRTSFVATPADEIIMKDTDPYFRVLNLTTSTFNDAFTSYFHKSIGGYHGAKLRRYQDVIDNYLGMYIQAIVSNLQDQNGNVDKVLQQTTVLNMLNTKYIIYNPNQFPLVNTNAYGYAWFVDNYKFVETAQQELDAIGTENLERTAVINKTKFDVSKLPELSYSSDSSKYVALTNYEPDRPEYEVYSPKTSFVVFSDIYYPLGWTAYIDDEPTTIYQTDYILRGLLIPEGKHTVRFEFKPASVFVANKIAVAGGFLVVLVILGALFMIYKEKKTNKD
ncbi:MAG: hypothetical protein JXL97_14130 [Bacteroidales bacterium]|nr:hypothetical protein [Bacteroidales bacterium]